MTRRHNPVTTSFLYRGIQIYSDAKASDGHYTQILDGLFNGIEWLFTHTSRINVFRFELYFKEDGKYVEAEQDANRLVSVFMDKLKRRLKAYKRESGPRQGESYRIDKIFTAFVRERSIQRKTHFHCAIAFKSVTQSPRISRTNEAGAKEYVGIFKLIDDAWRETCETGYVNFGSKGWGDQQGKQINHFYQVDRADTAKQDDLMKGLSYLAKVKTKEDTPKGASMFRFSQIRDRGPTDFRLVRE